MAVTAKKLEDLLLPGKKDHVLSASVYVRQDNGSWKNSAVPESFFMAYVANGNGGYALYRGSTDQSIIKGKKTTVTIGGYNVNVAVAPKEYASIDDAAKACQSIFGSHEGNAVLAIGNIGQEMEKSLLDKFREKPAKVGKRTGNNWIRKPSRNGTDHVLTFFHYADAEPANYSVKPKEKGFIVEGGGLIQETEDELGLEEISNQIFNNEQGNRLVSFSIHPSARYAIGVIQYSYKCVHEGL